MGNRMDARTEALDVISRFHLDPRNSWLAEGDTLGDFPLIVDSANGAYSEMAADMLRRIHGGDVVEVNGDAASGQVNFRGGVTDLEGITEIGRADPRFKDHAGVQAVLERRGKAMVFDADGDRFFRLDYDPEGGKVLVGAGDRNALLQAAYLAGNDESGDLFVTTVESDLNAYRAAEGMGFTTILTGVGDIRILHHAAASPGRFAIGSEESGHTITPGVLTTRAGEDVRVFISNGLKSAINTFTASVGKTPKKYTSRFALDSNEISSSTTSGRTSSTTAVRSTKTSRASLPPNPIWGKSSESPLTMNRTCCTWPCGMPPAIRTRRSSFGTPALKTGPQYPFEAGWKTRTPSRPSELPPRGTSPGP